MMNIVECVNQSGSFSFIADKSLDANDIKKFLKCARFFGKVDKEYVIRKDFLCCILVQNVTEKELMNSLVINIKDISINLINMRRGIIC